MMANVSAVAEIVKCNFYEAIDIGIPVLVNAIANIQIPLHML